MQAVIDKIMEDEAPSSPKRLMTVADLPNIVRQCLELSLRCCTGNEAASISALKEALQDWDPEDLAARSNADMPLAVNLLMSKAQNIPVAEVHSCRSIHPRPCTSRSKHIAKSLPMLSSSTSAAWPSSVVS